MKAGIRCLAVLAALSACATAAHADDATPQADLVCDQNAKIALVRFAVGATDGPPHFSELPTDIDGRLSGLPGNSRTDCQLSKNVDVRIRAGEDQTFAYGMGGGNPPAFFSLWIGHRKVLSKFVWKPGYTESFDDKPWLVGLVIRPQSLTLCYKKTRDKTATCKRKTLELRKYAVDTEEYPSRPRPRIGTILIDPKSSDVSTCKSHLEAIGKTAASSGPDFPSESPLSQTMDSSPEQTSGDNYSLKPLNGKFANIGERRVVDMNGSNHYFDGDIFVIVPRQTSLDDISAAFTGEDIEKQVAKSPRDDWTIIAGGSRDLYPDVSARYVHLLPEEIGGELFLLASPTNREKRPSAVLLKPLPTSGFAVLCAFRKVEPHY